MGVLNVPSIPWGEVASCVRSGVQRVLQGEAVGVLREMRREEAVMWLAASPLMFSVTMFRVLRRNVRVEMQLANTEEEDAVESMELGTVMPLLLSTPGVNVVLFSMLAVVRRGYLLVNVVPSMCLACFTSLLSRTSLYFLSWSLAEANPATFSPPILLHLFHLSAFIDAVLFAFSAIPTYRHYKHQVYRRARHDILKEMREQNECS
eukprot:TRINITY_DN27255_c0_g1_i1.p2 TRINITY_DN27255_c0_g1~~TRINITY_DN27255_c0_g1_i1.p2  ORF type:complete len:206 (+),score=59.53 TRINITY_DN27255_c0_g1_i1:715-1332(+)